MRTCKKCGQEKSGGDFRKYRSICKGCEKTIMREWYQTNRERVLKRHAANFERAREYAREYHRTHPQLPGGREYRQVSAANTRSKKAGATGRINVQEWHLILAHYAPGGICLSCGKAAALTLDHVIPFSRGGANEIGNIQPICMYCNQAKQDKITDYRPDRGAYARSIAGSLS